MERFKFRRPRGGDGQSSREAIAAVRLGDDRSRQAGGGVAGRDGDAGRTPPCASLMIPEMMPLVVCAAEGVATPTASASKNAAIETSRNIVPPVN